MNPLQIEAYKQKELYLKVLDQDFTLEGDPSNLSPYVGTIVSKKVYCRQFTEKLLAQLFIEGTEDMEEACMLIPVWQIIKYCKIIPKQGEYFTGEFAVGVRRILEKKSYVFTLRLPRN